MRLKKVKKILKYILLVVLIFFAFNLVPILFYRQELNVTPLPLYYKKGVYHMHSTFSDGTGTIDEITRAAAARDLDFVILTDHGLPNRRALAATGWYNGVLLIGGSELSLNCGHLAVAGFKDPGYPLPPEPRQAVASVNAGGGAGFIAHPFDKRMPWTDWDVEDFTGLEVMNSAGYAGKLNIFQFLSFNVQYLFNKKFALLDIIPYPTQSIKKWISLNRGGRYYAIYALDAHAKLEVTDNVYFRYPAYKSMFQVLKIYVKTYHKLNENPHESSNAIIAAMKRGNFFNVVEAIAPADGFEAIYIPEEGRKVDMGASTPISKGKIKVRLPFTFETDIVLWKGDEIYKKISKNVKRSLEIDVDGPGVYFLELFVSRNYFNRIPWILTNPFFIGQKYPAPKIAAHLPRASGALPAVKAGFFTVETNPASTGRVTYETLPGDAPLIKFTYQLRRDPGSKDFWACLAKRQEFDFSGFLGITFEARSSREAGFWFELRTREPDSGRETWFCHSFLADKEWRRVYVPFKDLHLVYGPRKVPDLSRIVSLFFAINNGTAYPGASGTLELKNVSLF